MVEEGERNLMLGDAGDTKTAKAWDWDWIIFWFGLAFVHWGLGLFIF